MIAGSGIDINDTMKIGYQIKMSIGQENHCP